MHQGMSKALKLRSGIPTSRYKPPPEVEIDPKKSPELPLIDGKTPQDQQIQEMWTAKIRIFDLSDEKDLGDYEQIWQSVCDGHARVSEHQTHFVPDKCKFVALLRWIALKYKVPS